MDFGQIVPAKVWLNSHPSISRTNIQLEARLYLEFSVGICSDWAVPVLGAVKYFQYHPRSLGLIFNLLCHFVPLSHVSFQSLHIQIIFGY